MNKILASLAIATVLALGACSSAPVTLEQSVSKQECVDGKSVETFLKEVRNDYKDLTINVVEPVVTDRAKIERIYRGDADTVMILQATNKEGKVSPIVMVVLVYKGCVVGDTMVPQAQVMQVLS